VEDPDVSGSEEVEGGMGWYSSAQCAAPSIYHRKHSMKYQE
jgi:hypothetical protein